MQENEVESKYYHFTVIFLAIGHLKNIFVNNKALYTSRKHVEEKNYI